MTKILWLSRHQMTKLQVAQLQEKFGDIDITQISATFQNVHVPFVTEGIGGEDNLNEGVVTLFPAGIELQPLKTLRLDYDVVAGVFPISLQEQLTKIGVNPLVAVSNRSVDVNGNSLFTHAKWERILSVDVIKEDL
jgi:hypothetical protein